MYNKVESRGAMFPRPKKSQNSPDMTGDFILQGEVLDYVAAELQRGNTEIKLYMSAWRNQGNSGPFNSFVVRPPMEYGNPDQRQNYGNQQTRQNYAPSRPQAPQGNSYQQASGGRLGGGVGNNAPVHPQQNRGGYGGGRINQTNQQPGGGNGSLSFPGDDEAPF